MISDFSELKNEFRKDFKAAAKPDEVAKDFENYESKFHFAKIASTKRLEELTLEPVKETPKDNSLLQLFERQSAILEGLTKGEKRDTIRLPQLKIPVFSGDFKEWEKFKNLFLSIVDKHERATSSEKLGHLLSLVSGEASRLIKHYPLCDASYATAWKSLTDRYDKPYLLTSNLIKSFLSAASVYDKNSIKTLNERFEETINTLDNMGDYYKSRDPWIIYLVTQKLDPSMREKWAMDITEEEESTLETLQNF